MYRSVSVRTSCSERAVLAAMKSIAFSRRPSKKLSTSCWKRRWDLSSITRWPAFGSRS
jgi:hypothetical protein